MKGTREVCKLLKITARQVQWLCEGGLVRPVLRDNSRGGRQFDDDLILKLAVIVELRRKGISLQRIGRLNLNTLTADFLIVQVQRRRYHYCAAADLLPYLAKAAGGCYVVSLEDLRAKLKLVVHKAVA